MSATGIGAAVRRKEDFRFITGNGQYTDDVVRPGETRAVFVRSPHGPQLTDPFLEAWLSERGAL